MYDTFTVRIIMNGMIVKMGCQRMFFYGPDDLAMALKQYIDDPQKTIDQWKESKTAKISLSGGAGVPTGEVAGNAGNMDAVGSLGQAVDRLRIRPLSSASHPVAEAPGY